MASRVTLAWLLAVASACTRTRPPLDDANEIRLDAIVELTAHRARSVISQFSVDPRTGSAAKPIRSETVRTNQDPEAELFGAVLEWVRHIRARDARTVISPATAPSVIPADRIDRASS